MLLLTKPAERPGLVLRLRATAAWLLVLDQSSSLPAPNPASAVRSRFGSGYRRDGSARTRWGTSSGVTPVSLLWNGYAVWGVH